MLEQGDFDGLLKLLRCWEVACEVPRQTLQPAENQAQVRIGVFTGGSYRKADAAARDALIVEADTG